MAGHQQQRATASALDASEASLLESEERFRQMADNIQEIFWMIDAPTKKALYVNRAYETITGRSRAELHRDPLSYIELIHPEDRVWVGAKLEEASHTGNSTNSFGLYCRTEMRDGSGRVDSRCGTAKGGYAGWSERRRM